MSIVWIAQAQIKVADSHETRIAQKTGARGVVVEPTRIIVVLEAAAQNLMAMPHHPLQSSLL